MKKFITKIILILSLFGLGILQANASFNFSFGKDYFGDLGKEEKFINIGDNPNVFALDIANSIINIFFIIAIIYFFILVIKLIISSDADEEHNNFKKGFIWITLGLIVMQIAKVYVNSIYLNSNIETPGNSSSLLIASSGYLIDGIIKPLTNFLETGASFLFIMISISAFYKLITSNGDDDAAKTGKMMIFYSIIGFIIIKVATTLINAVYGKCQTGSLGIILNRGSCNNTADISGLTLIVTNIINWMNSFIGIGIVIMVIYAGIQLIFSKGDEEKINSGKKSLLYIFIGVGILVMNYLILTFFLKI